MSSNPSTHLPLLPSARRKKIQIQRLSTKQDKGASGVANQKDDVGQDMDENNNGQELAQDDANSNGDLGIQNGLTSSDILSLQNQKMSPSHPFISSFPLPMCKSIITDKTKKDEQGIKLSLQKETISEDNRGEIHQLQSVKNEQIQNFSTIPPLSASTTTNSVMHFMHTTIRYMNNLSHEVDEKLNKCEETIEDLEIKLSLIENKLDSTRFVRKDNIMTSK